MLMLHFRSSKFLLSSPQIAFLSFITAKDPGAIQGLFSLSRSPCSHWLNRSCGNVTFCEKYSIFSVWLFQGNLHLQKKVSIVLNHFYMMNHHHYHSHTPYCPSLIIIFRSETVIIYNGNVLIHAVCYGDKFIKGDQFPLTGFGPGNIFSQMSFGPSNLFSQTSFGPGNHFSQTHFGPGNNFSQTTITRNFDKKLNLKLKSSSAKLKTIFFVVLSPHVKIVWAETKLCQA